MKITKKIINKIEGEALLKLYGDEVIGFGEVEFWQYRGIEDYLKGRDFLDALVINPRVCGICGHSHLIATAEAIESAFDVKITQKAKILRDITGGLEIIQNHIKWFYITLYPTLIKDKSFTLKAFKISSFAAKIIALIAGQFPHNSYAIAGGVTCDLGDMDILKVKEFLKRLMGMVDEVIREDGESEDLERLFERVDKNIGKGLNRGLVLGENLYFKRNGDFEKVSEGKTSSLYKNAFYENRFVEVGPLWRNIENERVRAVYGEFKDSVYSRIFARLYETRLISSYLLDRISKIDICEPSVVKYRVFDSKGVGVVEAPRGPLIHKVEIKEGKIADYQIIVPTQFNLSNGTKEKPSAFQKALMGEKKEMAEFIFKCFDICAACAVH